jgi:capsular polysaccharide transport system permease protein
MVDFVRRAQALVSGATAIAGARPRDLAEAIARYLASLNLWFWAIVGLPTLIAGVYFVAIASDLYSSEVKFIVRGPPKATVNALSAMLSSAGSAVSEDTFAVHEYVMSRDAVRRLEREVDLARPAEPAGGRPDHALPRDLVLAQGFRSAVLDL